MLFFTLSLILLVAFRSFWFVKEGQASVITSGDSMAHLKYVKEYYRTNGKPMNMRWLYTLDESDYPNGFHKLFYYLKIPVTWLEKFGGLIPILCDGLLLTLLAFAISIFGGSHYEWLLAFPFLRSFYGNPGRAHHFSERAYGGLWGNVYLLCVIAFSLTYNWIWLVPSLIAFLIFSVSSKFTWQGTALISLALSLISLNVLFIALYIVMGLLSFILSGGYSLRVLKGLIRHSHFYKTYLAPRSPTISDGHYAELLSFKGVKSYIYTFFTNSPLRILSDNPLMLLGLVSLFFIGPFNLWAQWLLIGPLLVLLISTRPLAFLGEPERYLEFTIIPLFIYLSFISVLELPIITILSVLGIVGILAFHIFVTMSTNRVRNVEEVSMIDLRKYCHSIQGATIITIPFRISFFLGYENPSNKYVTLFVNIGKKKDGQDYRWLMKDRYLYVRKDLQAAINKFNIDYIVAHKPSVKLMNDSYEDGYYDLSRYSIVYENEHYSVLKTLQ